MAGTEDNNRCVFKNKQRTSHFQEWFQFAHDRKYRQWCLAFINLEKGSQPWAESSCGNSSWLLQLLQWVSADYSKCPVGWYYLYLLLFVLLLKSSTKERGLYYESSLAALKGFSWIFWVPDVIMFCHLSKQLQHGINSLLWLAIYVVNPFIKNQNYVCYRSSLRLSRTMQ